MLILYGRMPARVGPGQVFTEVLAAGRRHGRPRIDSGAHGIQPSRRRLFATQP